ncbi:MAG: hypothetical protein ACFFDT_27910 [Candidatus Hodarchaeota archaeon]
MALSAHVLSAVILTKYFDLGFLLFWMILGQITPDLFKGFIFTGVDKRPAWQVQKHLPMGITHVPMFHVGIGVIIWFFHPYSIWPAFSYIFGATLHSLLDFGDQYGVLLLYPFRKELISIRHIIGRPLWNCGSEWGGAVDARAFFMTIGGFFEISMFLVAIPGVISVFDVSTYESTPIAIFVGTFVLYNFLVLPVLFLFPIIKDVPIPKSYTYRIITWRTPKEYEGETPKEAIKAQNQMGFLMGVVFIFSLVFATVFFL